MNVLEEILYPAVLEAQRSLPVAANLSPAPDAVLFGDGGLDSMGLVQFIIIVEERLQDQAGVELTLASDKAMSRRSSPFQTLGTLAAYIEECLAEGAEHA